MNRRVLVLDALLLVLCISLGRQVRRDFQKFRMEHSSASIPVVAEREDKRPVSMGGYAPVTLSAAAYEPVSSKNLFLESRNLKSQEDNQAVEAVPPMNPKPILVGVAKVGDQMRALVRRQQVQPGKRAVDTLRIGDLYEGYKVNQITADRVEFAYTSSAGQVTSQVISLFDPANRQGRQVPDRATPVSASQIIQVGAGAGAPSGAPALVAPSTPAAAPGAANAPAAARSIPVPGQTAGGEGRAGSQAGGARTSRPMQRNEFIDDQGRRVIRTPFGDVVRPPDPQ